MAKQDESIRLLKKLIVDGFILGGLTLCALATELLWQPFKRGFFCGDQSLMYPYHADTVSEVMLRSVGLVFPFLAFFVCEWALLRNETDDQRCLGVRIPVWVRGFYTVALGFSIGACFSETATNIAKNVIGRPRPHFFDICKPTVNCSLPQWQNRYIEAHEYTCTGELIDSHSNEHKSFLSGHSSWAAYSMIYLTLYLEKRMTWTGTRYFRHSLQFIAIMMSWFCALSRVSDYRHHWSDVLAGYSLGMIVAFMVWNKATDLVMQRKNHVLPKLELTQNPQIVLEK